MPLPTQANITRPEGLGYDALLEWGTADADSLYLRLALGPGRTMRFQVVEPPNEGLGPENPEDMRFESGQTFSRANFTGGEGLSRAHRRPAGDNDFTRFWDSKNIDISPSRAGQAEEIKLLKAAVSLRSTDATNTRNPLLRVSISGTEYVFGIISDNERVDQTNAPMGASPTWTVENPGGTGAIADIASLGEEVYAARGEIRKRSSGGSWAAWSDLAATRVWGVKGRIIGSTGAALYEAASGAGSTLLHTLPDGKIWNDVVDAGAAILAAASDGLIYSFAEQNGTLVLRSESPIGGENTHEIPTALGVAQGLVFVGTSEATTGGGAVGRLYRGILVGLRLRELQPLREWGDGTETRDRSPKRIVGTREDVWTGIIEDGSETHLWRYHLETGGVSRDLVLGASGLCQGIAIFDDRILASVDNSAVYREGTTFASTGYIISPLADFYNAAKKTWIGARLTPGSLPTGTDVTLFYSTDPAALEDPDHASWTSTIAVDENTASSAYSTETFLSEVQSRYIAAKIVMTPNGAATSTPTVLGFAFRSVPIPTEQVFEIPVNVSNRIERPGFRTLNDRSSQGIGDAVSDQIHSIMGQSVTLTMLRTGETLKGQLLSLATPIQEISERGEVRTFALMRVKGQRQ